jgi:L-serine dehydratase
MVGPSSSHTAGAVRIGYVARKIFREEPVSAEIILHGSFAATGLGHGTDRALVAGLLGMHPDDSRIPNSFEIAQERGLDFRFESRELRNAHPNTAKIKLRAADGRELEISAASVGGGRIEVRELAGMPMRFTADKPTLIISNDDKPGSIAKVSEVLSREHVNIATFNVNRSSRGGRAIMVIECDSPVSPEALQHIAASPGILTAAFIDPD